VVWGTPDTRRNLTSIQELLIETPSREHVRLKDVADVRIAPTATEIHRDMAARRIDVTANVRGRDLAAVAAQIERGMKAVQFPLEYRAELLGEYAERLAAQDRVRTFAIAAAIAILLLLQAFFRSWRLAAAVFVTLPMALVGGVLMAFVADDGLLSLGSIAGFVALLGIAVRSGTTLVGHYRRLEQRDGGAFGAELVERGTREWSAPILMTAITMALAVVPLAVSGNIAGLEILRPMAVVILGGLVTTTLLSLVGVPAMYLLFGAAREAELEDLGATVAGEEETLTAKA